MRAVPCCWPSSRYAAGNCENQTELVGVASQVVRQPEVNKIIALSDIHPGSVVNSIILNYEGAKGLGRWDHSLKAYIKHAPAISFQLKER